MGSPLPLFNPQRADTETRGAIPDKEAARCILHDLLQLEPYEPRAPGEMYVLRQQGAQVDPSKWPGETREPSTPLELKPLPVAVEARLRRRLKKDFDPGRKKPR